MKKLLIFSIAVFFNASSIFSQELIGFDSDSQNRIGFKLGYHVSNMDFIIDGTKEKTSSASSFHATIFYEVPFASRFYLQPALSLFEKGSTLSNSGSPVELNPLYIEVPVNILAKIEFGNGQLFFGGGPYVALGIAGSVASNIDSFGRGDGHSISYGSDPSKNDLKKFDMALIYLLAIN